MKLKLTNVSSPYGAPMGRRNVLPEDTSVLVKLRMERLRFVDGDYDQGGAYWGGPATVYCAHHATEPIMIFVRGDTRDEAKDNVRDILPNARFWR